MKSLLCIALLASAAPFSAVALSTTSGKNAIRRTIPFSSAPHLVLKSSTTVETETASTNLSPFLQEMVDEQRELQMDVGKAMDVLRKDYPYFLKRAPGKSHWAIAAVIAIFRVYCAIRHLTILVIILLRSLLAYPSNRLQHLPRLHHNQRFHRRNPTI